VRKYIFDTWRKVCLRYGFEEYLTPLFESADIYRAKSGEDIGGKELLVFKDLGDRELAVRPEMTPSVVRMVSKIYKSSPKPLKLFSIANFFRNEKPQRGRNREFWQLNCDIFGSDNLAADIEIINLALDIMLEFAPPKGSFVLKLNSRKLLEAIFKMINLKTENKVEFFRILDKYDKLGQEEFNRRLAGIGTKTADIQKILQFMTATSDKDLKSLLASTPDLQTAYSEIKEVIDALAKSGYDGLVEFGPAVIRGFDYYDGLVFEVFDKSPENSRAMFGGGRYNGLANIFGENNFPAVGFAPGDETLKLFLESWGIAQKATASAPEKYYLPLLDQDLNFTTNQLAKKLRLAGKNVLLGLDEQKVGKALEFANKKKISKVLILGAEEAKQGIYKIKDMASGQEEVIKF
jgi:histidyl-tRNA synthetase